MTWSAVALGGAVATIIMIPATLAEFSYIPTTWNNTSHNLPLNLLIHYSRSYMRPNILHHHCGTQRYGRVTRAHPGHRAILHFGHSNSALLHHAFGPDVWRSCGGQVKKVPR